MTSIMNDTKWRAAIAALQAIPRFRVRFRVKDVGGVEPRADHWEKSFPWHVPTFVTIEWLDIDPIVGTEDFTAAIVEALEAAHVPFTHEAGAIRIWGYR